MASEAALSIVIGLRDNASGPLKKITGGLTTLGKVSAGLAVGGLLGVGAGLASAASAGLGFNNSMEQATARLNAFTGDAGETAKILEMVRERAAKTPFAFEEMAAAAASLGPVSRSSGVDLEALIAKAEILAASNPAQGFEGAVLALKEATGGDWTSIVERFDLPRQRLKELADQGVPAVEAITIAMGEMGLNADLVSNMATTAAGRWSTLLDTFTTLASTITAPIFEGVSKGMGDLQAKLDENMPRLQAFASMLGEKVGVAVSWLASEGIPGFVSVLSTIGSTINDYVIGPARDVITAFDTWKNFGTEWGIVAALQSIGENFPLLQPLTDWLANIAPDLVQGVREAFGLARDAFITFRDALGGEWHADPAKIHPLHLAVGEFGKMIRDEVLPRLKDLYASLMTEAPKAWDTFKTSIQEDVMPWLKVIADELRKQRDEDLPASESKWVWFGQRLGQIIESASLVTGGWGRDVRAITTATIEDVKFMGGEWERTMERWESNIETKISDAIVWFTDLQTWLAVTLVVAVTGLQAAWGSAWAAIGSAATTAKDTISSVISTVTNLIQGAINRVNDLIRAINSIPLVPNLPTIPTAPTGGGRSGFGTNSIGISAGGYSSQSTGSGAVINIDARGASNPRAVEEAGYRGAQRALREKGIMTDLRTRTT